MYLSGLWKQSSMHGFQFLELYLKQVQMKPIGGQSYAEAACWETTCGEKRVFANVLSVSCKHRFHMSLWRTEPGNVRQSSNERIDSGAPRASPAYNRFIFGAKGDNKVPPFPVFWSPVDRAPSQMVLLEPFLFCPAPFCLSDALHAVVVIGGRIYNCI